MKPIKFLFPFAIWLFRIAILLFALTVYFETFKAFNFSSMSFYIALLFIIFSLLLFVGGFFADAKLTVISALILCLVCGYQIIMLRTAFDYNLAVYIVLGSILFYFLTAGNKK